MMFYFFFFFFFFFFMFLIASLFKPFFIQNQLSGIYGINKFKFM